MKRATKKRATKRANPIKGVTAAQEKQLWRLFYAGASLPKAARLTRMTQAQARVTVERTGEKWAAVKRGRKANPDSGAAAARMFEKFHQKPATGSRLEAVELAVPTDLAALGRVVELHVRNPHGSFVLEPKGITLACTGDGKQLYFVGGDQVPPLKAMGVDGSKVHVELGELRKLVYFTRKGFHKFEPVNYVHTMGEDGGRPPLLNFDTASELLYLVGGTYRVRPEGIVH